MAIFRKAVKPKERSKDGQLKKRRGDFTGILGRKKSTNKMAEIGETGKKDSLHTDSPG